MDNGIQPSLLPPALDSELNIATPVDTVLPSANDSGMNGVVRPMVPRPPDPAIGGEPGRTVGLGYSTGLLPSRHHAQSFKGDVITVGQPIPPIVGPVGYRDRSGKLSAAVAAQQNDYTPTSDAVAQMFTGRTFNNPLTNPDGSVGS